MYKLFLFLSAFCVFVPSPLAALEPQTPQFWVESSVSYGINNRFVYLNDTDFGASSPIGGNLTLGYKFDSDISFFFQVDMGAYSDSVLKVQPLSYYNYSYELDTLQLAVGVRMHNQITDNLSGNFNLGLGLLSQEAILTSGGGSINSTDGVTFDANHFMVKFGLMLQYNFTENIYAFCEGSFVTEFISNVPENSEGDPILQWGEYRIGLGIQF